MRIAVSSDKDEPAARTLVLESRRRGHQVSPSGVLRSDHPERTGHAGRARPALRLTCGPLPGRIPGPRSLGTARTEPGGAARVARLGETDGAAR